MELEQKQDLVAYSLFLFNISASTRGYYLRRLKGFFDYIMVLRNENIKNSRDSVMVMSLELREITIVSGNRRVISSISKVSQ